MIAEIVDEDVAEIIAANEAGIGRVEQRVVGAAAVDGNCRLNAVAQQAGDFERTRSDWQRVIIHEHRQQIIHAFPRHAIEIRV